MKILVVQETDWIERGPHQQHHLMERLQKRGDQIRVIDYEIDWKKKSRRSIVSRRTELTVGGKVCKDSHIDLIRPTMAKLPLLDYFFIPFTHGFEIRKQIKTFRPDAVIGLGILNTYIAMRLCRGHRVPFIYYLIDSLHTLVPEKAFRILAKTLESRTLRGSDAVVVINRQLGDYAIRMGANPRKVKVLGAGIDSGRFNTRVNGEKVRENLHILENEVLLFFMGWLYRFSGIKEVAQSLLKCKESQPRIKLLVLGRGDLYEELLDLEKRKLRNKLILLEWQPYENVPQYIASSDVCLLPSYNNEIMRNIVPIKVYEYMACGKPVITTKLPGIVREFGNGNGIVYVDNAGKVLETTVRLSRTKGKFKELGLRAASYVEKYSWENIVAQFDGVLRSISKDEARAN
jgi:glycosyltransferase involved in cell wall biosynthesis